jgi:hypothetical protein
MKYLGSPQHGDTPLWRWEGDEEVTIACHFCWIAGPPILKTQLALLRTLLHRILQNELDLVPEVCQSVCNAGALNGNWSVYQLQDDLRTAVVASRRRLCVFIDGLDEILPESNYQEVVEYWKQLATCDNVKLIVSSRAWKVFRRHCSTIPTIHMKSVNRMAIIGHLEKSLGALSDMSDVSWSTLRSLPDMSGVSWNGHAKFASSHTIVRYHEHGDAHELVCDLVNRSSGNFLWLFLVTNTILRLSSMGIGLAGIRDHIDELPNDLETYFRKMIFERGGQQARRVTTMALRIALLPMAGVSWISFWLLINSINGKAPSLEQAGFAHVCFDRDRESVGRMMQETEIFLGECCRDIPDASRLQCMIAMAVERPFELVNDYDGVGFTHRTIYDFLKTREMQELLDKPTPQTFQSKYFWLEIIIAGAKALLKRSDAAHMRTSVDLRSCGYRPSPWKFIYDFNGILEKLRDTELREIEERSQEHDSTISQLVEEMEKVTLQYFFEVPNLFWDLTVRPSHPSGSPYLETAPLCFSLATFDRYCLADAVLERWPEYALEDAGHLFLRIFFPVGATFRMSRSSSLPLDTCLLRKLLVAGADPNERIIRDHEWLAAHMSRPSVWHHFLQLIVAIEASSTSFMMRGNPDKTFSSPDVQIVIKHFLEFGAELEPFFYVGISALELQDGSIDPLATLRRYLPMDAGSEWPALLEMYLQPKKREELREARQKLVESLERRLKQRESV